MNLTQAIQIASENYAGIREDDTFIDHDERLLMAGFKAGCRHVAELLHVDMDMEIEPI